MTAETGPDISGGRVPSLTLPSPGLNRASPGTEGWRYRSGIWAAALRRIPAAALITLSIAGCEGSGAPPPISDASGAPAAFQPGLLPPGPATPRVQLRVGFGGLVDTIQVSAIEQLPLREAALVAPDGTIVPANDITVSANPRIATGQWSLSNRWEDSASPDSALAALALPNAQAGAALRSDQQLLAMVSRADLPLPDPVAYRRDWRDWRVRLTFGTSPGELETLVIAAPEPPPS
jgi:hypothetical protein